MGGGGSHWDNYGLLKAQYEFSTFLQDGRKVERPAGYSSDLYTDLMLDWMKASAGDGKPFFAYLAFQAVHDPVQAPRDYIDKYKGRFDEGYDKERIERFERMKRMGVIPPNTTIAPKPPLYEAWDKLTPEQKRYQARLMEIYAAMIDNMDHNIGRVIRYLKDSGQYDDTLIVFFSDNGPTPVYMDFYPGNADGKWIRETFDNRFDNLGLKKSFVGLGPGWASVGATPLRLFKFFQTEGGTLSPLIVKSPQLAKPGTLSDSFAAVEDLYPTILDAVGVSRPPTREGRSVAPLKGSSMMPLLTGRSDRVHPADYEQAQELWGSMYYRKGDWKLLWLPKPFGSGDWELYDTKNDRGETTDLAAKHPELVAELKGKYQQWTKANGVIDWDYDFLFKDALGYFDWTKGQLTSPSADRASAK
jgi:arylsulfatase